MPLTPDELKARFLREIDRRGGTDRYIDTDEERELLQIALAYGFDTTRGRSFLADACRSRGYVVERDLRDRLREQLAGLTAGGHPLTRSDYERLVKETVAAVAGTPRTEQDVRRLVLTVIEDSPGVRVKTGWLKDWHASQRRRAGLA